jgi:hypothetical protein
MSSQPKSWSLSFYQAVGTGPQTLLGTVTLSSEISSSLTNSTINFQIAQVSSDVGEESLSEVLMTVGGTG